MVNDGRIQSYVEAPDEPVAMWILDLNGARGIISYWSSASTSDATKAQLAAMVDSIKIG